MPPFTPGECACLTAGSQTRSIRRALIAKAAGMLGYGTASQDLIKREEIMFGEAWGSADGLWKAV